MESKLICIGSRTKVNQKQVVALIANENYSITHLSNGQKILTSTNLGILEARFLTRDFVRIHRSSIVNINFLKKYDSLNYLSVTLKNNLIIRISRRRRDIFKERLEEVSIEKKLVS